MNAASRTGRWVGGASCSAFEYAGGHINRFKPYLQHRFRSGATNATALFREMREHGYRGSRVTVTKYVATLRDGTATIEPKRAIPRTFVLAQPP